MKKLFLILSMLMCICFNFTNAEANYTTAQQDITIEKTIDNNTSTKIAQEDYTNTIIITIAILIYIIIAAVLVYYGLKGKVVIYRNTIDPSLCVGLFAVLPLAFIIFMTLFLMRIERDTALMIMGVIAFIWACVVLYIAYTTLRDNRNNPLLMILILPSKIALGLWYRLSIFAVFRKSNLKTVAQRREEKQNALARFVFFKRTNLCSNAR
ncbi:hypothetical protein L8Y18_00150 [Campylobacter sp. CNRCH_2007_0968H]|uniref:hypothetical protein n=1 Tax=Campylobacter sp. CNRCH_2007_0968H TaxID=2911598 RepID=UPI0021E6ABF8|nr:hypothetical protein [Campylobacter sp. CNRCH_2007_0968H]MCV3529859.1 hypothetical protein [Campylobacter sp. CNRCH_2007_0968H]